MHGWSMCSTQLGSILIHARTLFCRGLVAVPGLMGGDCFQANLRHQVQGPGGTVSRSFKARQEHYGKLWLKVVIREGLSCIGRRGSLAFMAIGCLA